MTSCRYQKYTVRHSYSSHTLSLISQITSWACTSSQTHSSFRSCQMFSFCFRYMCGSQVKGTCSCCKTLISPRLEQVRLRHQFQFFLWIPMCSHRFQFVLILSSCPHFFCNYQLCRPMATQAHYQIKWQQSSIDCFTSIQNYVWSDPNNIFFTLWQVSFSD